MLACFSFGAGGTFRCRQAALGAPDGAGQPARKCVDEKCISQAQTILCFATRGGSIIEVTRDMDNAGTLTRLWPGTLAWKGKRSCAL